MFGAAAVAGAKGSKRVGKVAQRSITQRWEVGLSMKTAAPNDGISIPEGETSSSCDDGKGYAVRVA